MKNSIILFGLVLILLLSGCGKTGSRPSRPAPSPSESIGIESYEYYISEGRELMTRGRFADAAKFFEKAAESGTESVEASLEWADSLKNNKEYDKALEVINNALARQKDNGELIARKVKILYNKGDYDKSIDALEKLMEIDGEKYEILKQIAHCYEKLKNRQQADQFYQKALEKFPEHLDAYSGYAAVLQDRAAQETDGSKKTAYLDHSIKLLSKALEMADPDDIIDDKTGLEFRLGSAYMEKWKSSMNDEDKETAVKHLNEFLNDTPDHPWAPVAKEILREIESGN